jgi:hypothetical protein
MPRPASRCARPGSSRWPRGRPAQQGTPGVTGAGPAGDLKEPGRPSGLRPPSMPERCRLRTHGHNCRLERGEIEDCARTGQIAVIGVIKRRAVSHVDVSRQRIMEKRSQLVRAGTSTKRPPELPRLTATLPRRMRDLSAAGCRPRRDAASVTDRRTVALS